MKRFLQPLSLAAVSVVLIGGAVLFAKNDSAPAHEIVSASDLKWTPIISGWELAVVSGNPDKDGEPFTIRFRGADGAKVPPHWHPTDENVTVLEGTFMVAVGDKYDEVHLKPMTAGSFLTMPKEMHHFARAKGKTIIQAHGIGPFKVNWVNPSEVVPPAAKK